MHLLASGNSPDDISCTVDALAQLRRGVLEHCVLALLSNGERYGYDLVGELSHAGLVASKGTIYPLHSRLRKDALVETTWRESDSGPPRRYYLTTAAGRAAVEDFRRSWQDFSHAVNDILDSTPGKETP